MSVIQIANDTRTDFAPLRASSVAVLTTFRRNGEAVSTPVGIIVEGDRVYCTTWSTTGKVKRLANNPRVTLAPSNRRGKVIGPAVDGIARRLDGEELRQAERRNGVLGALWRLVYRVFYRAGTIYYEVVPVDEADSSS